MRTNVAKTPNPIFTAGGARATKVSAENALRRTVLACLLWEDNFYEDGVAVADRLKTLAEKVSPEILADLAIEARHEQHLRHVPLMLLSILAKRSGGKLVTDTIERVISRADELSEFLAVHAKMNGVSPNAMKRTVSAAMKRGLAKAFLKFDEYQLGKYNRDNAIELRDVLFLCHAKPDSAEREQMWDRLVNRKLAVPDTWETELSNGADKKATFERLLREEKLGYMALLRNLRNMEQAKCDATLIREGILARKGAHNVLPFRYLSAAKHAPRFEQELDRALVASFANAPKLPGKTILVVDVSGSMHARLSSKSEVNRLDAAASLAAVVCGMAEQPVVYATAGSDARRIHDTRLVPARPGMAMIDVIKKAASSQGGGGIFLTQCMAKIFEAEKSADRIIVFTDEQDCDIHSQGGSPNLANAFGVRNYMINVSTEKHGIGYKPKWLHIDGWSDNVLRYILNAEQSDN